MKGGDFGTNKVVSSQSGDFLPKGHGISTTGHATEMGEKGEMGKWLPGGSKGPGVKGVSGGGGGTGSSLGKNLPDGSRGWAKGV